MKKIIDTIQIRSAIVEVFKDASTDPLDALQILSDVLCQVFILINQHAEDEEIKAMLDILFKNIRNEIVYSKTYYRSC